MKNNVEQLQEALLNMPQGKVKTTHSFCNGVYAREITVPKDSVIVGAKHKTAFFMVISKGRCIITSNNESSEYRAPCTLISPVGAKRAILAKEETVLTTFHVTDKTDIEEIEHDIIESEGLKIANNGGKVIECHG